MDKEKEDREKEAETWKNPDLEWSHCEFICKFKKVPMNIAFKKYLYLASCELLIQAIRVLNVEGSTRCGEDVASIVFWHIKRDHITRKYKLLKSYCFNNIPTQHLYWLTGFLR